MTDPEWLTRLAACPSTNTWALEHLDQLGHGACVVTDRQTAGRGQAGRTWISDPGVLTASWVLHLERAADAPVLSLAAGLALAQAIEEAVPDTATIALKWPNDAYLHDRKLAGILCEARSRADGGLSVVVGIGCNVDPAWGECPPAASHTGAVPPIALREVCTPPPTIAALLPAIRRYLLEAVGMIVAGHFSRLLPELRRRNWFAGRHLLLDDHGTQRVVRADDLDDQGRLVVVLPDGGYRALDSSLPIRGVPSVQPGGCAVPQKGLA